jgi:dihydroflavonol-4-reductase
MITAVTGASGHLGANLVRALLAEGRKVRVLVRGDRLAIDGLDVETVQGDILDTDALSRLTCGAETVFHMAARISIVGSEDGLVERTNVDGVHNVIEACRKSGVRRLVHCSSIHAFSGVPVDETIDETRPLALGRDHRPYDRSKAMGQMAVLDAVRRGLDAVVINPSAVIGPNDFKPSRVGEVILDICRYRLPALLDGGYNWVDVRDVAAGAIAAEKKGRSGECYLLTGHWAHLCEVSAMIGRITGRKTPMAATPLWLALPAAYVCLVWGLAHGKVPKFTPAAIEAVRSHRHMTHEKASRELDYAPRPLEDTLEDTLQWFCEEGMLSRADFVFPSEA